MNDYLYVILTPPPNPKSAGITYLNNLGGYLRRLGKESVNIYHVEPKGELYLWSSKTIPTQNHWNEPWKGSWIPWTPGIFKRTFGEKPFILIHGENKNYKFFEDLNVVRYYLAGINDLQKKGVAREGEFKVAWDEMYCEKPDFVLAKPTFRGSLDVIKEISIENRNLDLTYVGKAWIHSRNTPRLKNTLELTRNWPDSDEEYFYLLSKTRFLFTYDPITSVISDAILLGAFPIILDNPKINDPKWLKSMNEKLAGCFGFYNKSHEDYLDTFSKNRENFIETVIQNEKRFNTQLKIFCEKVEDFFKAKM